MPKPPAFQFYARDWITDERVRLMPLAAQGVYIRLLCHQWLEGSLPANERQIALIAGLDARQIRSVWPFLESLFPLSDDGTRRFNPRLFEQYNELKINNLRRSAAGKIGAGARWQSHANRIANEITSEMRVPMRSDGSAVAVAVAVPVPEGTGSRKPPEETPRTRSPKPPYQPSDLAQRALSAWISHAPLPVTSSEEAALKTLDDCVRIDHVGEEDLLVICHHGAQYWVPAGYIASPCKLRRPTRSGEMKTWEAILRQAKNGRHSDDPLAEHQRELRERGLA